MAVQVIDNGRGRKYAVLSEELYKMLKNANQKTEQTESPEFEKIKRLDNRIQEILNDKNISTPEKAKLYSLAASEFIDLRKRAPEIQGTKQLTVDNNEVAEAPPAPAPEIEPEPEVPPPEEEPPMAVDRETPRDGRYIKVSERGRVAANRILDAIEGKEHIVDWNPHTKELIIDGNTLKNSNIEEILSRVTKLKPVVIENKRKKTAVTLFLRALGRAGVDPKLIPNNILRKIVKTSRGADVAGYGNIRWRRFK